MSKILKNNDVNNDFFITDLGTTIAKNSSHTIDPSNYSRFANSSDLVTAISNSDLVYNDGENDLAIADATMHLQGSYPKEVGITKTPPFAEPDYRTKRDATSSWVSLIESENKVLDFQITEERYVTGGEIIFKDVKEGDYISAEVYDTDSVIPVEYRAALCEAHPVVAKYVVKKWLKPCTGYNSFMIDTYPLNAKISVGLYLRVTYHSSAEVGTRKIAINYHLTKKLV